MATALADAESHYADRGRQALENWAHWILSDSAKLGYPRRVPYYRMVDVSELWDSAEERADEPEYMPAIDEDQARAVEAIILGLSSATMRVIRGFYLRDAPIQALARELRMTRREYEQALDDACATVGRALDTPVNGGYIGSRGEGAPE